MPDSPGGLLGGSRCADQPVIGQRICVVYLCHVAQLSGGELALLRVLRHARDVVNPP